MSNESELPSPDTRSPAPGTLAEYGDNTVPPIGGGHSIPPLPITIPPFSTNSYQSVRPKDVSTTAATNPPMGSATDARTRPPMPVRRGLGAGLLIKLFTLTTKLVPIAGVLVGGYYSYTYFFGPVPVVEAAAERMGVMSPAASNTSKAGQMLQQTRDVVAANNSKVGFANALAGDLTEGFPATAEPDSVDTLPVNLAVLPPIEAEVEAPPPVAILDQFAMFEAERAQQEAVTREVETVTIEPEPEKVVSSVPPSARFRQWVSELRISGVRTGDAPKVMVNGLTLGVGGTIDHRLGITFEGLAQNDQVLVFKDRTDALLTVEY